MRTTMAIATATLLCVGLIVVGNTARAQPSGDGTWFHSAQSAGGTQRTSVTSVATTGTNAPVITGDFAGTTYFPTGPGPDDSIAITPRGATDMYVAAQNANDPYFSWVVAAGGTSYTKGYSVDVSADGKLIVTGDFWGTTYFPTGAGRDDSIALVARGEGDIFVAALDPVTRHFDWVATAGGTGADLGTSVAVSVDDTPILTGGFHGTAYFPTGPGADDSIALTQQGNSQGAFVAAVNPGTRYFTWAVAVFASGWDSIAARSIALTRGGVPVLTGSFRGTAYFVSGPGADDSVSLTGGPNQDEIFVAAVNPSTGKFSWATSAGGAFFDGADAIAMTRDDTPIITGMFRQNANFPTGPGADDSIAVTGWGTNNNMFVAALKPGSRYFAWVTPVGTLGNNRTQGSSVAVTVDDTAVFTGYFSGTAYFPSGSSPDDSIAVPSRGGVDAFVAAMNLKELKFTWALGAGGTSADFGGSVAVSGTSTPIVAGTFGGTAYFPTGPAVDDSIALASRGGVNLFLARTGGATSAAPTFSGQTPPTTGAVGTAYAGYTFTAAGTGPIAFTKASGTLPPGLTLAANGLLSGMPTTPGAYIFTVKASNGINPDAVTSNITITISAAPDPGPGPGPLPAFPPSVPRSVMATPGDAQALLSWNAPADAGSLPVTQYQVRSSPGSGSCITPAPTQTCTVPGLTNGTTYTFTVRALNGAGWSADSEPSNAVTPRAEVASLIVITGSRDSGNSRYVRVTGTTTGLAGELVTPWMRFPRERQLRVGVVRPEVGSDGTFTWSRRTARSFSVYFTHNAVKSNTVVVKAR